MELCLGHLISSCVGVVSLADQREAVKFGELCDTLTSLLGKLWIGKFRSNWKKQSLREFICQIQRYIGCDFHGPFLNSVLFNIFH